MPNAPRPSSPPPPPPRPAGPAQPPRPAGPRERTAPRLVDDTWFRIGVAVGVVGALLLAGHIFEPFLLLGALPVKRWRAAA